MCPVSSLLSPDVGLGCGWAVAGLAVISPVINDINWPGFCLPPIRKCGCVGGGAGAGSLILICPYN